MVLLRNEVPWYLHSDVNEKFLMRVPWLVFIIHLFCFSNVAGTWRVYSAKLEAPWLGGHILLLRTHLSGHHLFLAPPLLTLLMITSHHILHIHTLLKYIYDSLFAFFVMLIVVKRVYCGLM